EPAPCTSPLLLHSVAVCGPTTPSPCSLRAGIPELPGPEGFNKPHAPHFIPWLLDVRNSLKSHIPQAVTWAQTAPQEKGVKKGGTWQCCARSGAYTARPQKPDAQHPNGGAEGAPHPSQESGEAEGGESCQVEPISRFRPRPQRTKSAQGMATDPSTAFYFLRRTTHWLGTTVALSLLHSTEYRTAPTAKKYGHWWYPLRFLFPHCAEDLNCEWPVVLCMEDRRRRCGTTPAKPLTARETCTHPAGSARNTQDLSRAHGLQLQLQLHQTTEQELPEPQRPTALRAPPVEGSYGPSTGFIFSTKRGPSARGLGCTTVATSPKETQAGVGAHRRLGQKQTPLRRRPRGREAGEEGTRLQQGRQFEIRSNGDVNLEQVLTSAAGTCTRK
ncbi:unnamed protein product, partial [Pleuronectes platessa]